MGIKFSRSQVRGFMLMLCGLLFPIYRQGPMARGPTEYKTDSGPLKDGLA